MNTVSKINAGIVILLTVIFLMLSLRVTDAGEKVKVTIFPFKDIGKSSQNISTPLILEEELSRYDFIDIIPLGRRYNEVYEIEPAHMWAGMESGEKQGGILWNIRPVIIEEARAKAFVKYAIFGNIVNFDNKSRLYIYLQQLKNPASEQTFDINYKEKEQIPDKITSVAKAMAAWIKSKWIVSEAEEHIRKFMGGINSHSDTIAILMNFVKEYPTSVPIQALLLDMYIKKKDMYNEQIITNGLKLIDLYDNSNDENTRYLLSLNLDPYDATAEAYEMREEWIKAIETRNNALKSYPHQQSVHKTGLGKDHYFLARSLELKGQKARALEHYKIALSYLPESSVYYEKTRKILGVGNQVDSN